MCMAEKQNALQMAVDRVEEACRADDESTGPKFLKFDDSSP
jgi:hypothetical protein